MKKSKITRQGKIDAAGLEFSMLNVKAIKMRDEKIRQATKKAYDEYYLFIDPLFLRFQCIVERSRDEE